MRLRWASLGLLLPALASARDDFVSSPDPSPEVLANSAASNASLLWGTYRPQLYFGLRPRVPESLLTGLLWFGVQDYKAFANIRHAADQGDGLAGYTWTRHDGRTAGQQRLRDPLNNVELWTELLKVEGGEHGGSWGARIRGKPLDESKPMRVSFVSYFGLEGLGELELQTDEDEDGLESPITLAGNTPELGAFTIRIAENPTNNPVTPVFHPQDFLARSTRSHYVGLPIPAGSIWRAKELLQQNIVEYANGLIQRYGRADPPDPAYAYTLTNEVRTNANLFAFQRAYDAPFEFDIVFDSGSSPSPLNSDTLTEGLRAFVESYDARFEATFQLGARGFSPEEVAFARDVVSNTVGGIGYFYGSAIVDRSFVHDYDDDGAFVGGEKSGEPQPRMTPQNSLFTATPSRSFFPRGFYWDEGFHQLIIGQWDNDLSLEILKDWVKLIDEDGWVGREQILGDEARSRVPTEFQTQYPHYANPPTLTMAIAAYINRLRTSSSDPLSAQLGLNPSAQLPLSHPPSETSLPTAHLSSPALARSYLYSIYPALRRHYRWFRSTQRGQIREWGRRATSRTEAYRWRGRTHDHVLTSGLDDYPRAVPPHVGELHLDLASWMASFSKTMAGIAEFVGELDDLDEYEKNYEAIVANIEDLHWSEEKQMYCDASVDDDDESYHVCHRGYVSLFPLLLHLLPPSSPHVGALLDLMRDPAHLWSEYGLRSLSASHPLFGQGENYWRGPVWVHMNYMALRALHNVYAREEGPYQERAKKIYDELRDNIIRNVFKEYERTGYVWEQYDSTTGKGQRSHPFTGWTALTTLIMAEIYD